MAKGNLFQGMARGKVGDVVFSRLNGEQISRVRNRHPNNPRTNAQMYQRAIMSTIMQAYSAGKQILDHSFEGQKVGEGCQRRFMSVNAKMLRAALASDIEKKPIGNVSALLGAPSVTIPVPNKYIVSQGSLEQNLFNITEATDSANAKISVAPLQDTEGGSDLAVDVLKANGINAGDIFTIVGYAVDPDASPAFITEGSATEGNAVYSGSFFFIRLMVRDVTEDAGTMNDLEFQQLFRLMESNNVANFSAWNKAVGRYSSDLASLVTFTNAGNKAVAIGIIKSRENEGLRSNESLHWVYNEHAYGITWENALDAWKAGTTSIGNSDLILEGGNGTTSSNGGGSNTSGGDDGDDEREPNGEQVGG